MAPGAGGLVVPDGSGGPGLSTRARTVRGAPDGHDGAEIPLALAGGEEEAGEGAVGVEAFRHHRDAVVGRLLVRRNHVQRWQAAGKQHRGHQLRAGEMDTVYYQSNVRCPPFLSPNSRIPEFPVPNSPCPATGRRCASPGYFPGSKRRIPARVGWAAAAIISAKTTFRVYMKRHRHFPGLFPRLGWPVISGLQKAHAGIYCQSPPLLSEAVGGSLWNYPWPTPRLSCQTGRETEATHRYPEGAQ